MIKIKNVTSENIEDFIKICIPPDKLKDESFIKGFEIKKKWILKMIEKYQNIGKIAYFENKPVGMIQYKPVPDKKITEINCIFVPEEKFQRKGIAKNLFKSFFEEVNRPQEYFDNEPPDGIIVYAFPVPGRYPQHLFFEKMGFKKIYEDNPYLMYCPLKKDFTYKPEEKSYKPVPEDKGKAIIFYNPSCPWSIYFSELMKKKIKEVLPDVPVIMYNRFEDKEEVIKRVNPPDCIVNAKEIKTFVLDNEGFKEEVERAWER